LPLIDPDVAAVEWLPGEQELLKDITPKPNASDDDDEEAADGLSDDISLRKKMARSRAIKERYAARLAKLEYKERSGLLVEVESVKKEWTQVASIVRTKVMGIPSKARQRIPELSQEQIAVLQAIVSSTLEDLADGDD
jgi:phage terminase Nu1 subunit (DNA packaging protein)